VIRSQRNATLGIFSNGKAVRRSHSYIYATTADAARLATHLRLGRIGINHETLTDGTGRRNRRFLSDLPVLHLRLGGFETLRQFPQGTGILRKTEAGGIRLLELRSISLCRSAQITNRRID
jgi:hypothetical protein